MNVPDRLRAIADEVEALLRGPIISAVPRPQDAAARYLAENPDVAQHIYFGRHPLEHWQIHGQKEGRRWPDMPEAPRSIAREPAPTIVDVVAPGAIVGQFDADSLSDTDAAYVYAFTNTQDGSALAGRVYWQGKIFSGSTDAINRLINRGEQKWNESHMNAYDAVAKWPDSPLKRAVTAV